MKNKRIATIKRAIKIKRVNKSNEDIVLADESQHEKNCGTLVLLRIFAIILKIVHFR